MNVETESGIMSRAPARYVRMPLSLIALFSVLFLLLVYHPVASVPNVFNDGFRYFSHFEEKRSGSWLPCETEPEFMWLMGLGRPLAALGECALFNGVTTPDDLLPVRHAMIGLMALVALLLFVIFHRYFKLAWPLAGVMALGPMLLPGASAALFTTNIPHIWTLFSAALAALLAERAFRGEQGWGALLGALLLLAAALLTYVPLALFYFYPLMVMLLFTPLDEVVSVRRYGYHLGFFGMLAGLYFVTIRLAHQQGWLPDPSRYNPMYAMQINLDLLGTVSDFFTLLLPRVLNLWNVYSHPGVALLVLAVLLLGLGHTLRRQRRGEIPARELWVRLAIGLLLFGAVNVVYLLRHPPLMARLTWTQGALVQALLLASAASLAGALVGAQARQRAQEITLGTLLLAGALVSAFWMMQNVRHSAMEFDFIKYSLPSHVVAKARRIHSAIQRYEDRNGREIGFNGHPVVLDEFNLPSSRYPTHYLSYLRILLDRYGMKRTLYLISEPEGFLTHGIISRRSRILRATDGGLVLINRYGERRRVTEQGRLLRVEVAGNEVLGRLSGDGRQIAWQNGALWQREPLTNAKSAKAAAGSTSFTGLWRVVTPKAEDLMLTYLEQGHSIHRTPQMVLIDFAKLYATQLGQMSPKLEMSD